MTSTSYPNIRKWSWCSLGSLNFPENTQCNTVTHSDSTTFLIRCIPEISPVFFSITFLAPFVHLLEFLPNYIRDIVCKTRKRHLFGEHQTTIQYLDIFCHCSNTLKPKSNHRFLCEIQPFKFSDILAWLTTIALQCYNIRVDFISK